MKEEYYISIMEESLEKKLGLLNVIEELNQEQSKLLGQEEASLEAWEELAERKEKVIEEITELDQGFGIVYERVAKELELHKNEYKKEIRHMQECIQKLTAKSVDLQAQEHRNRDLALTQFSRLKKRPQGMRQASRVSKAYSDSMNKVNLIDAQFMDRRK